MIENINRGSRDRALASFDPFGPAFRSDPESFHPKLIEASPGFMAMAGVPSAFVASYADCSAVLKDSKKFSSVKPKNLPGMDRIDFFNGQPVMNYSDAPDHIRRRKVVNPAFTPKRTARIAEACGRLIDRLLDEIAERGTFDAVGDLTKKLSLDIVLGEFMGVARKDYSIFLDYISTIPLLDTMKPGDPKPQPFLDAWARGVDYCRSTIASAHSGHASTDNIVSLISASGDGGALDDDEMMAMMVVLFSGGISTMAGAATGVLYNMVNTPGMADRVRTEGHELAERLLEESMRMYPPVSLVMRFAGPDASLAGETFPLAMPIYVMIASACHDPAVFPDPYRCDPDRSNVKDHLAFGQGMHTCIGNTITRRVVPMLAVQAARRFPTLRLARPDAEIEFHTTPRSREAKSLLLAI